MTNSDKIKGLCQWYNLTPAPPIVYEEEDGVYDRIMVCIEFVRRCLCTINDSSKIIPTSGTQLLTELGKGENLDFVRRVIRSIHRIQKSTTRTETEEDFLRTAYNGVRRHKTSHGGPVSVDEVLRCPFYNHWRLDGDKVSVQITNNLTNSGGAVETPLEKFARNLLNTSDNIPVGAVFTTSERAIGIVLYAFTCIILVPYGYVIGKHTPRDVPGAVPVLVKPNYDGDMLQVVKHLLMAAKDSQISAVELQLLGSDLSGVFNQQKLDLSQQQQPSLSPPPFPVSSSSQANKYIQRDDDDDDDPLGFEAAVIKEKKNPPLAPILKNTQEKKKKTAPVSPGLGLGSGSSAVKKRPSQPSSSSASRAKKKARPTTNK